ncbi:MAG: flagellar brake protein [Pseudohongiella sp.]|nr:flagellar brake protein [Pseudohongiella sp.]MDP3516282.1 flagellar brake protein [Pseudohongiella sp.]
MATNFNQERHYTSTGDIYAVLRALQTDRSSISIQFDNSGAVFASMVLSVNLKEKNFVLDEFSTGEAHKRAEAGTPFTLRASVNGIKVLAKDLKLARVGKDANGLFYEIDFPEKLLYLQRRDAFRAWVPGTLMVNASCKSENHPKGIKGRIQNMSATGFRLLVDGKIVPEPDMLESFNITTHLPLIDQDLRCDADAVYAQFVQERNHTIVGFRFGTLGRTEQIAINRFVTQLQRERIA